jgi:hypothetical protein
MVTHPHRPILGFDDSWIIICCAALSPDVFATFRYSMRDISLSLWSRSQIILIIDELTSGQ